MPIGINRVLGIGRLRRARHGRRYDPEEAHTAANALGVAAGRELTVVAWANG